MVRQPQALRVGMPDDQVVLIDNEHVPLTIDVLRPVVVGEGGIESLGLVPADGLLYKELGVLDGADLGGMEATTRAMRSASAAVSPGSGWASPQSPPGWPPPRRLR